MDSITERAVAAAEKIQGWMSVAELRWLSEQAQKHNHIVEVGCWKGRSTKALALSVQPGGVVWAVDPWGWALDETGWPAPSKDLERAEAVYLEFAKNLCHEIAADTVRVVRGDIIEYIMGGNWVPDMVFIDGNHDYVQVKKDIEEAQGIVKHDGLLCGHDYGKDWPGVIMAVEELLPGKVQRVPDTSIWFRT